VFSHRRGFSLPAQRVIRSLQQIIEWRGKPNSIRCNNDPEYISQALIDWAIKEQITLLYTQPGKLIQTAYIKRFNRMAKQEWLELNLFEDTDQAQILATQWQWTYNNYRQLAAFHQGNCCNNNDSLFLTNINNEGI